MLVKHALLSNIKGDLCNFLAPITGQALETHNSVQVCLKNSFKTFEQILIDGSEYTVFTMHSSYTWFGSVLDKSLFSTIHSCVFLALFRLGINPVHNAHCTNLTSIQELY